jgi:hypothetical protein
MLGEHGEFLPDDAYRFLGRDLAVRSNSRAVLEYIRSVYRWFRVPDGPRATPASEHEPTSALLEVVDRLDSAGELSVRDAVGSYTIRCRDARCLEPNGASLPDDGGPHPLAFVDGSILRSVARLATDHDLIHAGAVSAHGRAVILAGDSGRGKTTICLKMLERGASLLSDEVACVRRNDGVVEPFPRLMKLDEQSRRILDLSAARLSKSRFAEQGETLWLLDIADAIRPDVGAPAALCCIILLEGFADRSRLQPVSHARALLAIARQSLRRPADAAAAVFESAPFMGAVPCYSLTVGDLEEAADLIRGLLDAPPGAVR